MRGKRGSRRMDLRNKAELGQLLSGTAGPAPRELKDVLAEKCRRLRAKLRKQDRHGKTVPLSRHDIAARSGISLATYERIESAKNDTTLATVQRLAGTFQIPAHKLIQ